MRSQHAGFQIVAVNRGLPVENVTADTKQAWLISI